MSDLEHEELLKEFARDQDENGVDLVWLRYNLSLSIDERVEKHRRAAESVLLIQDAARRAKHNASRESA
jgi:hypothetical protein